MSACGQVVVFHFPFEVSHSCKEMHPSHLIFVFEFAPFVVQYSFDIYFHLLFHTFSQNSSLTVTCRVS